MPVRKDIKDNDSREALTAKQPQIFIEDAPTIDAAVKDAAVRLAYWQKPCDHIACTYGLTARKKDVLRQLARGHSLGAMENTFVLSRNTIKMHIRHIYDKLDVHSKQEVIDMVDRTRTNLRGNVA